MLARDERDASTRSRRPADHEQSRASAAAANEARAVGDQHLARRDRQTRELGARSPPRSSRGRRRQVEAQILPALGRLHENARAALEPQPPRRARRSATRASIASVPSAASTASTRPSATTTPCPMSKGDSAPSRLAPKAMSASHRPARRGPRSRPPAPAAPARNRAAPTNAQTFALEHARDALQQRVVAAAKEFGDLGRALDRAPVEPQVGEFRAASPRRGSRPPRRPRSRQRREELAEFAEPHPDMGESSRSRARPSRSGRPGKRSRPAVARARAPPRAAAAAAAEIASGRVPRSRHLVPALARRADRAIAAGAQERDDLLHRRARRGTRRRRPRCAPSACPSAANNCL